MQADILRDKFLDFFRQRKHKIVESDSLVPHNDPTILFTPAGMNQFKKEFLGFNSGFKRAATAQRCLRTDDLDKVGKTPGHHTFFEMLGNFSFGDYFKEEAITYAWEFLTEEIKLPKEKLWVSVYKDDTEAYKIWKEKIKIPENKITKLGDKENFWPSEAKEKGPNGPCGPCSEIFFDQVEVWNLVFTQFNRKADGILEPLPKKNIDTGMGLERLTAVLEGLKSNFETELFQPIIKEIGSRVKGQGLRNQEWIYAISDHIRAIVFAIYDGVLPSNDGRGYVVRKLIRKSSFHLQNLGVKKPFLYTLVAVLSEIMRAPYPELDNRRENISEIILAEEKNFISTFQTSDTLFKEKFAPFFNKDDAEGVGKVTFQLYDTYGIPMELTQEWLNKNKLKFSQSAFNQELEAQKSRSRLQSAMKGDVFGAKHLKLDVANTKFLGYKQDKTCAKVIKILKDNAEVKKISQGDKATIILDKTCFYAASGGQVGDTGKLTKGKNIFEVYDTQKMDKVTLHLGEVKQGSFKKSDALVANIDAQRRFAIAKNHTATHLLQAALRKVLGSHVQQQGSLVAPDRLRFDFTHFKDVSAEELDRIEETVNDYSINNYPLKVLEMPLASAKCSGALAFFAEKYEGKVRVVSVGDFSKELCAGSHLTSTGLIGHFKIIREESVASGIRRIEAVTAKSAFAIIKKEQGIIDEVSSLLNAPKENIIAELNKRLSRTKELDRQVNRQKLAALKSDVEGFIQEAQTINKVKLMAKVIPDLDMDNLRNTVDLIKQKIENSIIALGSQQQDRALLVIGITQDLAQKGWDASKLILDVAKTLGGSGGGRKDFAQAGGNKPQNFQQAFEELKTIIAKA